MREPSSGEVWSVVFFHSFVLTKCKRTGILTFLLFSFLGILMFPRHRIIFMWLGVSLPLLPELLYILQYYSILVGWAVLQSSTLVRLFLRLLLLCSFRPVWREVGWPFGSWGGWTFGQSVCVVLACVSVVVYGGLAFATSQCSLPWTPRRGRER